MLHGRMEYGMERYEREHPEVDILLIEPTRDDLRMFSYNIMRYSARRVVAEHGYRSTLRVLPPATRTATAASWPATASASRTRGALPEKPAVGTRTAPAWRGPSTRRSTAWARGSRPGAPAPRPAREALSRTRPSAAAPAGRRSAAG